jgi:quercetin dioxygenase-like cupin family protein
MNFWLDMNMNKSKRIFGVASFAAVVAGILVTAGAQQPGLTRTVLQRHELSVPGNEAVSALAEFPAGVTTGRHTHPGDEIAYILEGTLVIQVEGKPSLTLKAGDMASVPAGTIHEGRNPGPTTTRVLSTYLVEKGATIVTMVP